jgi:IMP dehydrogenase
LGGESQLVFEEGVDGYVPYVGRLKDNLEVTLYKIKSTLCNCGVANLMDLQSECFLTLVSQQSFYENSHTIQLKETDISMF